jgi:hypothetical protein
MVAGEAFRWMWLHCVVCCVGVQEEIGGIEGQVLSLATAREGLRADLRDNLFKRQTEIEASLASLGEQSSSSAGAGAAGKGKRKGRAAAGTSGGMTGAEEEALRVELDRAELVVRELEAELDAIDAKIAEKKTEVRKGADLYGN